MTGQVTDSSGALLPNTVVTLVNHNTGTKYKQTTDAHGSYSFTNVTPGSGYTVTFTHDAFSTVQVTDLTLSVSVTRTQDAKMNAGTEQQIQVSASNQAVTIDTTDATIGGNIDISELDNLPIQSRASPSALFTLVPGYGNGSITGARTDQSSTTVDGIDVNDIAAGGGIGTIIGNAPVDSVEQFTTEVAGLPPANGTGSGGQTQLITKSGTNRFHGNINEYHRDTSTEANAWFNNNVDLPRTPIIQNQFGGNIGGPILKDKLFFFFNFLDNRTIESTQTIRTVPLDSYRNGTVGYINSNDGCTDASRANTTPTCITYLTGAQLAQLDPQGIGFDQPLLSFIDSRYPHANDLTLGDGINTGGLRFNSPTPFLETNYVARVDYNLTPTNKIFGRVTLNRANDTNSKYLPTDPTTFYDTDRSYGYVASDIWQLGSNKVNQFYYGDNISKLSFPPNYVSTSTTTYGFGGIDGPYAGYGSQKRRVPIPEVRDDFQWLVGNHSISFGGQFKFIKTESQLIGNYNGYQVGLGGYVSELDSGLRPSDINTTSGYPDNIFDSLYTTALGRIGSTSATYDYTPTEAVIPQGQGTVRRYRYYETELYVGDTWKATPKLTIDYGVRYMLNSVPYETGGSESVENYSFQNYFNARVAQSTAGISGDSSVPFITYKLGGKANNAPNLYAPSYKDFAPRLGFTFAPTRQTVVRASAGLIYDRTVINAVNFIQDQSSQLFQVVGLTNNYGANGADDALANDPRIGANLSGPGFPSAPTITTPFTPGVANGTPDGLANNVFNDIVDPTLKDPYSIAITAGVEQNLPWHMVMDLNYAGRLGRRLIAQADASQLIDFPDPTSGQLMSSAISNLEKQARAGATYQTVTPVPWFENVVLPGVGAANGFPNNTGLVLYYEDTLLKRGDFADTIQSLAGFGILPSNVGLSSQFAGNTFITNKGFSSYNGLLLSLSKNTSNGLEFHFYYTWAHSIDNVSEPANYIASNDGYGYICDVLRPRECRANSDFNVNQRITGAFVYKLPVGRGRTYLSNAPKLVDEAIGGWSISGIPTFDTGFAINAFTDAYIAGYANNAPAIFNGRQADIAAHVHKDGSGAVQLFSNPALALSDFSAPTGFNFGRRNSVLSPSQIALDAGLGKDFPIVRQIQLNFRADFFNVLNHPTFADTGATSVNIDSPSTFGQISQTSSSQRVGQFSLRLEF
jgi:hypothetical protein